MSFEGKTVVVVIVTGASKGIGRARAQLLAGRGACVVALGRTGSQLDSLRAEIGGRTISVDLSDPTATRGAMAEAGTCDFLVNNAGTNVLESVLDMSEAGYVTVLGLNLRAALMTSQEFARRRIAAGGGGAIVNITSIAAHRGFENHMAYAAASKAGLEAASRVMAKELGPHGTRINCVAPTITLTELAAAAWSDPDKSGPVMVRHPLARLPVSMRSLKPWRCCCRKTAIWCQDQFCPSTAGSSPSDGLRRCEATGCLVTSYPMLRSLNVRLVEPPPETSQSAFHPLPTAQSTKWTVCFQELATVLSDVSR